MKSFKPSELPEDTVIEDLDEGGYYTKERSGSWSPDTYHCVDCADDYYIDRESADEHFKEFRIVALPMEVVEYIVEEFAKMTGSEAVLDEAIEAVMKPLTREEEDARQSKAISEISAEYKEDLKWKYLSSFENIYLEVNEKGQFRLNETIFSPVWDEETNLWLATIKTEDGDEFDVEPEYFVRQQFNKDWQRDS